MADKKTDQDKDKEKEYLVEKAFSTALTEQEQKRLKQAKEPLPGEEGRQDVFIDRRDQFRKDAYTGDERRKGSDRRDSEEQP